MMRIILRSDHVHLDQFTPRHLYVYPIRVLLFNRLPTTYPSSTRLPTYPSSTRLLGLARPKAFDHWHAHAYPKISQ